MQFLIKKPHAKVWEEMKNGVVFFGYRNVKVTIEAHYAMVLEYQTDGCLHFQYGTVTNRQTSWGRKKGGALPPDQF